MIESKTTIETSQLQNKLQTIYWKVILYIVIWTFLISILFVIKSLLIFFLVPIEHVPLMTYLLSPEVNSVEDSIIGSIYETILSLLAMLTSFCLMMIANKAEKLYIQSFKDLDDPQISLYSLEISGLPNIKSANFLASIFEGLHSKELKKGESLVADVVYIFDMEKYLYDKSNLGKTLIIRKDIKKQTSDKSSTENLDFTPKEAMKLAKRYQLLPYKHFSGKMIIVLRSLELVYDILNLFHCGLFLEKIRSDVNSAIEMGILSNKRHKILEALDARDSNALFTKLNIQSARDSHDLIWPYYGKPEISKRADMKWRILLTVVVSCLISFLVSVIYYLSIKELFRLKFVDCSDAWIITISGTKIFLNWQIVLSAIAAVVIPFLGSVLIESIADYFQMNYFSDYNNLRFRLEILFEVLYRYVFLHWAFTIAVLEYRDLLPRDKLEPLYKYIYVEWNKIALLLIFSTLLGYLKKHFKRCFEKFQKRAQPEKVRFSIDHSVSSVNLLLTFMYLGFYFPVLSVSVVILLMLNMLLNLFMYFLVYRNNRILRDYISYNNISMLANHCLVAFNVGGVMSLTIYATFTNAYFQRINTYSGALPSNFIGSIFMLIFAFINYMTNLPNSLYLRVIKNLLTQPQYKSGFTTMFNEALRESNYKNRNPYYIEKRNLDQMNMSDNTSGNSNSSAESDRDLLTLYRTSYNNKMFKRNIRKKKDSSNNDLNMEKQYFGDKLEIIDKQKKVDD